MRKLLFATAAAAALFAAIPASAQVYADPEPGVGVQVGPFGFGVGPRYGWYGYDRYAYDCPLVRERIVTPGGRVIFRMHRECY